MNSLSKTKVIVGLSGGVDSAVAAYLLKKQGYSVEALFMKNWDEDDDQEYCSAEVDLADAEQICKVLDIPLKSINFSAEYWDNVFEHFLQEYRSNRTPNPDIICNKEIKFKAFLDYAQHLGADYIATGHYVQKFSDDKSHQLSLGRGLDEGKDQSYFLYTLNQNALDHSLFPLGHYQKSKVREIAHQMGFDNFDKKDSTGICFIGERKFTEFLERFIPAQPGNIVDTDDNIIGAHNGLMFHTLGQRKGLGIGGLADSNEDAWYVYGKDAANNQLQVCQGHNNPKMFTQKLNCSQLHWVAGIAPAEQFSSSCKTRYRQADQQCDVIISADDASMAKVTFSNSQRAITPGQSIVFYQGAVCLGGGIIDSTWS